MEHYNHCRLKIWVERKPIEIVIPEKVSGFSILEGLIDSETSFFGLVLTLGLPDHPEQPSSWIGGAQIFLWLFYSPQSIIKRPIRKHPS